MTRVRQRLVNKKILMKTIIPCLWFDGHAEEAAKFYVAIFSAVGRKHSKVVSVTYYGAAGAKVSGRPQGTVMTVTFRLDGQEFMALNGGPQFTFSPAISFIVNCDIQKEVDALWEKLSKGGEQGQCGWLKDRYGVSWQIVPTILGEMLQDKHARKTEGVVNALLHMQKLDINTLQRAYDQ